MGQLRLFAGVLRDGGYLDARIDPAMPDRQPLPRSDLRLRNVPLGPVAVFGASNFPLAFSVAGGDTASALAAGCPVVVKAHSAHPGTSELVGRAVHAAVAKCGMPEGTFSLLFAAERAIGEGLVADHRIKAVGFTGSRTRRHGADEGRRQPPRADPGLCRDELDQPGAALPRRACRTGRPDRQGLRRLADARRRPVLHQSGLVIAIEGEGLDAFLKAAEEALVAAPAAVMLTPGICSAYAKGVAAVEGHASVSVVAKGQAGENLRGQAALFRVSAASS